VRGIFRLGNILNNTALAQEATNMVLWLNTCCVAVVARQVFPMRCAQCQKRGLRGFARKPATMKTCECAAQIVEINNYVPLFPPTMIGGQLQEHYYPMMRSQIFSSLGFPTLGRKPWCSKTLIAASLDLGSS
jgi:hypothetical protein